MIRENPWKYRHHIAPAHIAVVKNNTSKTLWAKCRGFKNDQNAMSKLPPSQYHEHIAKRVNMPLLLSKCYRYQTKCHKFKRRPENEKNLKKVELKGKQGKPPILRPKTDKGEREKNTRKPRRGRGRGGGGRGEEGRGRKDRKKPLTK